MKPHTRIIYYTLLCLALNHRRSRAHIYGGMEKHCMCFCLLTYLHQCAGKHVHVFLWMLNMHNYDNNSMLLHCKFQSIT